MRDTALRRWITPVSGLCTALHPSQALVACGAGDGRLWLWGTASGQLLRGWSGHFGAVRQLCFAANGALLISCGDDAAVHVWRIAAVVDTKSGLCGPGAPPPRPHASLAGHSLAVVAMAALHAGGAAGGGADALVTVAMDRTCRAWDVCSGAPLWALLLDAAPTAVTVARAAVFVACGDARVYAADLTGADGAPQLSPRAFVGHAATVTDVAVTPDCAQLLTASADSTARVWDVASRQTLRVFSMHRGKRQCKEQRYSRRE